jgi:hypothetical protein
MHPASSAPTHPSYPPITHPPNLPGKMQIEKMMSGLWMGDNARRLLLSFARKAQLFGPAVRRSRPSCTPPRASPCRAPPPLRWAARRPYTLNPSRVDPKPNPNFACPPGPPQAGAEGVVHDRRPRPGRERLHAAALVSAFGLPVDVSCLGARARAGPRRVGGGNGGGRGDDGRRPRLGGFQPRAGSRTNRRPTRHPRRPHPHPRPHT